MSSSKIAVGLSAVSLGLVALGGMLAYVLVSSYRRARFAQLLTHPQEMLTVSPGTFCLCLGAIVLIASGIAMLAASLGGSKTKP
jgi:hypothetical protein